MRCDFLAVAITEVNRNKLIGHHLIIIAVLIDIDANALVLNRLTRTIQGAVSKEYSACIWTRLTKAVTVVMVARS